ncbi:putative NIF3-like protein 1 (plasmid) [Legionella adelaidensis]|uniref:GTP cyclohydrolase 1 type 2 homolog n=1 Tax=Legionella adelaidensis TaxID=45056 RepID=A0A0W0R3W5_9GAMM|nr:Nif3-like dinuclear metal center hexameric protein [Legionella adelaidensis]KTC65737.1 putative NIF3-like protein 1 [Legionella adelaidensis]VEH85097.1 putative NIF3-like protein 1 [Legionella adelaidensis]
MIKREDLNHYLQDYLSCDLFSDYAPNGLQIEGKENIEHICTAVTASADVIQSAVALQADALLVHHGYFWRGENPVITGIKKNRISQLLNNNINLFAYHLPLDCHLDVGNNACLAELFEVEAINKYSVGKTKNLLWAGELIKSMTPDEFSFFLQEKLKRQPLHIPVSKEKISTIAWCSGGAQDFIKDAAALGVDAYISGEISERTYYEAIEMDIHYYACGHYATERYGIQALGHHLGAKFELRHNFIESENPV